MLDSVVDALRGRRLLLILDNCEHVLDAAAELAGRITVSCPTVVVLATSREPVGVAGERVWAVPSLDAAVEGVELFCDRAAAADADFSPTEAERAVIAGICGRLDGIPLAIELAAARVRSMTPGDLAERLDDRFRLLRGGPRSGLERHQTLRATVQWSHQLLAHEERVLFDRLAVFAGGFDLGGVEAVCADDTLDPLDVGRSAGRPGRQVDGRRRPSRSSHPFPFVGDAAPVRRGTPGRGGRAGRRCGAGTWTTTSPWPAGRAGRPTAPATTTVCAPSKPSGTTSAPRCNGRSPPATPQGPASWWKRLYRFAIVATSLRAGRVGRADHRARRSGRRRLRRRGGVRLPGRRPPTSPAPRPDGAGRRRRRPRQGGSTSASR